VRILAVTPYYSPEGGGLERYAHAILRRVADRGHEVRVETLTHSQVPSGNVDGVDVHRMPTRMVLGNSPVDPRFLARVRAGVQQFRPDLVVGHTPVPFAAEMGYLAAAAEDIPFVATYHSGRLHGSTPFLELLAEVDRRTLERRMLGESARLIAVSPYVRANALDAYRRRVTIVPPGVEHHRFTPNGMGRNADILFVAPLSRSYVWKGVDVLWDAFALIRRHMPEARLVLVGDGDRFQEMALRASRSGGTAAVLGRLSEERLVQAYRDAAVVVLPSTTDAEAFGMVLAEANACGRPVVGSRIGGIPDFVSDGSNGLLAEPADAIDLADKIETLLADPARAKRMGMEGRRRVLASHDWDGLTDTTLRVFEEAVA
jgi:glycosyltransferase involved in cell wall biosynthesis